MLPIPSANTINHLTLRWGASPQEAHTPATALRIERLLGLTDFNPVGMKPGAILLIRQLRVLRPLVGLNESQPDWVDHLRDCVNDLYQRAVRPHAGGIPSNADSILFADAAEMLFYLTGEIVQNQTAQQWYWQQVIPAHIPSFPGAMLTAVWSAYPQSIPAALGKLPLRTLLEALSFLSPTEVQHIIRTLQAAYAVSTVSALDWPADEAIHSRGDDDISTTSTPRSSGAAAQKSATSEAPQAEMNPTQAFFDAPWSQWLPDGSELILPDATHYLLGLILTLYHTPAFVRSPEFAARAEAWLRIVKKDAPLPSRQQLTPEKYSRSSVGKVIDSDDKQTHSRDTTVMQESSSLAAQENQSLMVKPVQSSVATQPEVLPPELEAIPEEGIPTELAGILYLVNFLLALELPGSAGLAEYISGWGLLEALARGLLADDQHADDAIWSLLAGLDNREVGTAIGENIPLDLAFRLPPRWLHRFAAAPFDWTASVQHDRLTIVDTAHHYTLVDVPLDERSISAAIEAETALYVEQHLNITYHEGAIASFDPLAPAVLEHISRQWENGLRHLLAFVRYSLAHSLAEPDPLNLARKLLIHAGRVQATQTHIDAYLPMDAIDISVRRLGLDFDPGWVPDLGYIIAFHFA